MYSYLWLHVVTVFALQTGPHEFPSDKNREMPSMFFPVADLQAFAAR